MDPEELDGVEGGWDRGEVLEAINLESELEPYTYRFEHSPFFLQLYVTGPAGVPYTYRNEGDLYSFWAVKGKNDTTSYRFFKPLRTRSGIDDMGLYRRFNGFLESIRPGASSITVYGIPDRKNVISHMPNQRWREFTQNVFEIEPTLKMSGGPYKPLREKIKRFERLDSTIRHEPLTKENLARAYDVIRSWKSLKSASQKTFGLEERVQAIEHYLEEEEVFTQISFLKGKPVAIHAAYRLEGNETEVAAHFLGICALKLAGLYETTQIEFWKLLYNNGLTSVNDGPTWLESLEKFKKKFVPKRTLRVYQGYYP